MASSITLRITVRHPLPGVELRLQRGRDELVPPVSRDANAATFECAIGVEARDDGSLRFRGPEVQGPSAARFLYINAGTYAGQGDSPWGRRAKVMLTSLRGALVSEATSRPGAAIACAFEGRAKDGGPAAATVPLLGDGWTVIAPRP